MGLLRSKEGLGHNFSPGLKIRDLRRSLEDTVNEKRVPLVITWTGHTMAPWDHQEHTQSLQRANLFNVPLAPNGRYFISSLLFFPCPPLNRLCTWPADFWVPCSPWADRLQSLLALLGRRGVERREGRRGKERLAKGLEAVAVKMECLEFLMGLALWPQPPGTGFWEKNLGWEIEPACPSQGTWLGIWLLILGSQTQVSPPGSVRTKCDTEKDAVSC